MKRDSFIIAGYYGFGNAGDELILLSLIRMLRKENPERRIVVFSADPAGTARSFDVQAVDRWRPWRWIRPLMEADRFILGGGGLLQETTGPWNYFYYLSLLVTAKIFGCTTDVFAVGVDPISGFWDRFLARFVLHHWTDRLSVRDEASRQALKAAGVRGDIAVARDPVFDLGATETSGIRSGIALALSAPLGNRRWAHTIAALCDRLGDTEGIPVDLLVLFPAEDEALALEAARLSSAIRHVRVCRNPEALLSWIPQYQLIAGTRFHALVLAAANHIPFFGWGTQKKVINLCREFGMPFWTTDEEWNLDKQAKVIRSLYQSPNKSVILAE